MNTLQLIEQVKTGNLRPLKKERWIKHLWLTKENKVNLEKVASFENIKQHHVLTYVENTLRVLESIECSSKTKKVVEEVLKWSEVAKGGMPSVRRKWKEQGISLFAHNEGSAQIYWAEGKKDIVVYTLIFTHGLMGQYLRGEVSLKENSLVNELIANGKVTKKELKELLLVLNQCIIGGVSDTLWQQISVSINEVIDLVLEGKVKSASLKERVQRLRQISISEGENFEKEYKEIVTDEVEEILEGLFFDKQLWYIEPALKEFSLEEFIKIFLLIHGQTKHAVHQTRHLSLEGFMSQIYYEYKGEKKINLFKKRIIEKYLRDHSMEDILNDNIKQSDHVTPVLNVEKPTISFDFRFSTVGEKLIDFCVEAEKSNVLHEQAVVLLFDLFELRRDQYDRFHNEEKYLKDMNGSGDFKRGIVEQTVGKKVLDIGPGSGVILDMIEETYPDKEVYGIDISKNVIEGLEKKKQKENRKWNVIEGDALSLEDRFEKESIDTIIYSSIIHELFSYIPYEGEKFNYDTIRAALKSAFKVLKKKGRIIIRDGIMSEPADEKRIIEFKDENAMAFLKRYANDFKGRNIQYEIIEENKVVMPINDCMEFLYTYTWGDESYVHEINEQFGYFTPSNYELFLQETLGEKAKIITLQHYLQEGYSEHLLPKVNVYNEKGHVVDLPDSTCFIVIEKQ